MIWLRLGAHALAGTRLSISPAMEAIAWLKLAAAARRHPVFGDPGPAARAALRHPDVALLQDLLSVGTASYFPDLLTPKPVIGSWKDILQSQLTEIEETDQGRIDTQVSTAIRRDTGRAAPARILRLAESGRLPRRLAAGLARFWRETLDDGWPALRTVLDHDIAERSKGIAARGLGAVLDGIHPRVHWIGESLAVDHPQPDRVIDLTRHDLVVVATVLSWPSLMIQIDEAEQAAVYYPAHRIGASGRPGFDALAPVVGQQRAALLADLAAARSTADLALRHKVSASTVSYHLAALLRAQLVTKRRDGRHVLYQRTRRADALLAHS